MRQEAKKLFYITMQLKASNSFQQILEGIQKSRSLIQQISEYEYLNTAVITLLDLFNKTRSTYIRSQITQTLLLTSSFITQLPSHPQITSRLSQNLRSNDPIIRIQTLQLVEGLCSLFVKDTSIYHYLLGKLKGVKKGISFGTRKETIRVIRCLGVLLRASGALAGVFGGNIRELVTLGDVNLNILLYLCMCSKFQPKNYEAILESVWQLCQPGLKQGNKVVKKYLKKIILKSCLQNYLCIQQYQTKYEKTLPQLYPQILKISYKYYSFLPLASSTEQSKNTGNISNNNLQPIKIGINQYICPNPTHQDLLDVCYEYMSVQGKISGELERVILKRMLEDVKSGAVGVYTVLLTFYVSGSMRDNYRFDDTFVQTLQKPPNKKSSIPGLYQQSPRKLLKISITTSNHKMSHYLLQKILNTDRIGNISAMMFFLCYTQLHLHPCTENLCAFLTVLNNLALNSGEHRLLEVGKIWFGEYANEIRKNYAQIEGILGYGDWQGGTYGYLGDSEGTIMQQEQEVQNSIKQKVTKQTKGEHKLKIKCEQQLNFLKSLPNVKINKNSKDKQTLNTLMMPACTKYLPYQKIYIGKRTILDIFKFL